MKKNYSKPSAELIVFKLDASIANCDLSRSDFFGGVNYNEQGNCYINTGFGVVFSETNNNCDTVGVGYCYYTSAMSIFNS